MLIVTCAIITQHGKILICQRSSAMHLLLKWEFPGGKVELGGDKLIPFVARVAGGELRLEEHTDARWITVDELGLYDWAPADLPIAEQVKAVDIW
ncbi:MAG TPA: hypothetical protein VNQ80_07805 [Parapedobacter sp.]|uniref:hypothetical protein n=1 Tax=Parapedobacter sp. TaxID=1958893 RepID=UPI002CDAC7A1|nr:hypothetical protein [Parapedobacter sp.]HWK57224.1 hypothetical protein [Parapedobacter sp.]